MSVAVRRALYGKMSGDSTLTNLLGAAGDGYSKAIYHQQAPQDSGYPFVIFQMQSGTPDYSLGTRNFDDELWLIKGIGEGESADPVDAVSSRLDALLTDGTLSISAKTQRYLRRVSDVEYAENADGQHFLHAGALYRLVYT